jgi:hypothetical protein
LGGGGGGVEEAEGEAGMGAESHRSARGEKMHLVPPLRQL